MSFSFTTTKLHKGPNEIRPPSKESAFLKSQRFKRPKRRRGRKKKPKVDVLQTWTTYTYRKRPSCHDVCSKAGEFCVTIKMHPVKTYGCDKPRMFTAIKVIFEKNVPERYNSNLSCSFFADSKSANKNFLRLLEL